MENPRDLYDVGKRFAGLRERVFEYYSRSLNEKSSVLEGTYIPYCRGIPEENEPTQLCPSIWQSDIKSPVKKEIYPQKEPKGIIYGNSWS